MHYQRDYEHPPFYKRTEPEKMQIVPKSVFGSRVNMFVTEQKFLQPSPPPPSTSYESKAIKTNPEETRCSGYYYAKELPGWSKSCSCGVLSTDYSNPIEYQPMLPLSVDYRMLVSPYSSQNNVCGNPITTYSKTPTGDFPLWLKIYSRASVECDHKLHWDMFNVRDLCFFDNVLIKLYELELEEIILWYKCYKNALLREMDKRLLEANQQRQMILLYNS